MAEDDIDLVPDDEAEGSRKVRDPVPADGRIIPPKSTTSTTTWSIADFLERTKPIRQLAILVLAIGGGMYTVQKYLVTRVELSSDECKIYQHLEEILRPIRAGSELDRAEWEESAATRLIQAKDKNIEIAAWLMADAERAKNEAKSKESEAEKKYKEDTSLCNGDLLKAPEAK